MSAGTVLHIPYDGHPGPAEPEDGLARRAYWAAADCLTIVRRDLTHLIRQPVVIAWQLGFPVVSVVLFVYVFGSAMNVGGGVDYPTFAMPGIFAMTVSFGFMNTAMAVVVDRDRGVTDRFRSLPMAPSAVVSGRGVSDVISASVDLAALAVIAVIVGWRSHGSPAATLAAFGLLLLLRFALIWIGIYLGLLVPNQETAAWSVRRRHAVRHDLQRLHPAVDDAGLAGRHRPVEPGLLDGRMAIRELFGNPATTGGSWVEQHAVLMAVLWPVALTAVFLPLAVRRFRRLSR